MSKLLPRSQWLPMVMFLLALVGYQMGLIAVR